MVDKNHGFSGSRDKHFSLTTVVYRQAARIVLFGMIVAGRAWAQQPSTKPPAPVIATPSVHKDSKRTSAPKHHWAELKWKASTAPGLEGYNVYRAAGSPTAKSELITRHPVKGTEYRDTQVEPGKTYFYTVTAVQKIKSRRVESEPTAQVTARIPSP